MSRRAAEGADDQQVEPEHKRQKFSEEATGDPEVGDDYNSDTGGSAGPGDSRNASRDVSDYGDSRDVPGDSRDAECVESGDSRDVDYATRYEDLEGRREPGDIFREWKEGEARYYVAIADSGEDLKDGIIYYNGPKPLETAEDRAKFVEQHKLKHGDVVRFDGGYRETDSYIVETKEDGTKDLFHNPDDHDAGYLTIPAQILVSIPDGVIFYDGVMNECEDTVINLHLSPKDKFISDKLGPGVPGDWQFDAYFSESLIDHILVALPGKDFVEFDWEELTLEGILEAFAGDGDDQEGEGATGGENVEARE